MVLTFEDMLIQKAEFCHIGITQNILPLVLRNEVFFPIDASDVIFTLMVVIGFGLMIGRGWCAWGCFWGGWEEGFSRIRKKAVIKKIPPKFRFLPFCGVTFYRLFISEFVHVIFTASGYARLKR